MRKDMQSREALNKEKAQDVEEEETNHEIKIPFGRLRQKHKTRGVGKYE